MWQAHSLTPCGCKQNAREFFPTPFGVSSKFAEKAFMSGTLHQFLLGGIS